MGILGRYKNRGLYQETRSAHPLTDYAYLAYLQRVRGFRYREIAQAERVSQKTIAKSVKIWDAMSRDTRIMFGEYFKKGYLTAAEWHAYTGSTPSHEYYTIKIPGEDKESPTGKPLDFYFKNIDDEFENTHSV